MNGGINIGTVNPGWNTQGSVVVSFRVSSTSVNPPNNHTNNNTCRIDYFRVSDDDIEEGDRVTFSWDASDCSYVTLTTFSERMNTNDSISARPTYSREYCLNAYGNGTDRECLDIDVDEDIIDEEENVDIEVATRSATSISESDATLNGFIDPNDSYATRWFRYGTSSGNLSRSTNRVNHGYNRANFSADIFNLAPNTRYYFQAVGENSDTTEYGKILNFNTNASVVDDNDSLSAVTTVATGISQSSAVINGLVLNTENIQTNAYFEYGRNVDLGSRTITKNLGSGLALNTFDTIYGLSPNTFYYFRVVGENGNGKSYGEIKFFQTLTNGVITPPVVPKIPAEALATLEITNKYELVRLNDLIDYTITYKNTGKTKLVNSKLKVFLPEYIDYINSQRGNYDRSTRELTVNLENLNPADGGVLYMQGRVIDTPVNNTQIVTSAMFEYINEKNANESVMAYVVNRTGENINNTNLAAGAFFAWLGSLSLCFWLFLIILILLAIMFSRMYRKDKYITNNNSYYNKPNPKQNYNNQGVQYNGNGRNLKNSDYSHNNPEAFNGGEYSDGNPYENLPK